LAELNLLQLTTEFCKRQALTPLPTTVTGSQDDTTIQIWGLLNEGMEDISRRFTLQQLRTRYTFNHAGVANYIALDVINKLPDFKWMYTRTLWDTTSRIEVAGPLSEKEWNQLLVMLIAAARYSYRLMGNYLRIFPIPNPLDSILFAFEYQSRYPVISAAGGFLPQFTQDTDMPRFPSDIVLADLKWRWREAKGLPYAEQMRISEEALRQLVVREPQPDLVLDAPDPDVPLAGPGLLIPAGSWNVH